MIGLFALRTGGADGIAGQINEYNKVLRRLGYNTKIISGHEEGTTKSTVIPELSYYFPYKSDLMSGKDVSKEILKHSQEIYPHISLCPTTIIFNALSYSIGHPALYIALIKYLHNHSIKAISHSADPLFERPEQMKKIHPKVLELLPDLPNITHIALNDIQATSFRKRGLTTTVIPDFVTLKLTTPSSEEIDEFLRSINKTRDDLFFLCPVRPIRRKRILKVIEIAKLLEKKITVILTHPDIDEPDYHKEIIKYAKKCNVEYIYLGDNYSQITKLYSILSKLNTIVMIASLRGGFENAILETAGMPIVISTTLNSYPILKSKGFIMHPMSFNDTSKETLNKLEEFIENHTKPKKNIEIVKKHFSADAVAPKIKKLINSK